MNPSTNRHVSMKANCDGKEQIFSNFIINLGNKSTYQGFTTHIAKQIKSAPDSPDYEFTLIKIKYLENKYQEITEENYQEIRDFVLKSQEKLFFLATAQSKESQYATKRTSIEPSHMDENHHTNRNPVEVRRAGTPPKRSVCSPLRSNTRTTPDLPDSSTRHGAPSPLRTRPQSPGIRKSVVRPASPHTPIRPIRTKTPTKSTSRSSTLTSSAAKSRSSIKIKRDRSSPHSSPHQPEVSAQQFEQQKESEIEATLNPFDRLVGLETPVSANEYIHESQNVSIDADVQNDQWEEVVENVTAMSIPPETDIQDPQSESSDDEKPENSSFQDFAEDYDEAPDMGNNIWRDSMGCCLDEIRNFKMNLDEDEEFPGIKRLNFDDQEDDDKNDEEDIMEDQEDHESEETKMPESIDQLEITESLSSASVFEELKTPTNTPAKAPRPRAASSTKKRPSRTSSIVAETASSAAKSRRPSRSDSASFTPKAATPVFNKKSRSQSGSTDLPQDSHHSQPESPDHIPSYARPKDSGKLILDTAPLKITEQEWQKSLRKAEAPKRNNRKQQTARERARQYDATMLRAMRQDTKGMMPDGRPSIDTMAAQWEFMRDQFLGSNENLEWMMTAKQGGEKAYKLALRKFQMAEDQYYKALFDIDIIEGKLRLLSGPDALFLKTLKTIADCEDILRINPSHAESCEIVSKHQCQLNEYLKGDLRGMCCKDLESHLKQIVDSSDSSKCSKKAKFVLQHAYPAEITQLRERLKAANIASNESLTEMEKWGTRYKETSQYSIVLAEEDMEWMSDNSELNIQALQIMRSLIPTNISELSIAELQELVKSKGTLYTPELATELKSNKLLHWVITHPSDIAQINFLNGEHRQYFVNLEALDVLEMRAIRMVLPDKFELDSDGKKAEWRDRFIGRLKQLVSQEKEEFVKGGWDPESGKRVMVKLPTLKDELKRRNIYFYRTYAQLSQRLKQYEDKENLLLKKRNQLNKADADEKELRQEYDTVLEETRDPSFKVLYGIDKLNMAKESAKREWKQAELRRNELRADVNRLQKSIQSNPVSKEQFIIFMGEQEALLGSEWKESDVPVPIRGEFDMNPEITRVERSAAKFESAEQEAERRKLELSSLSSGTEVMIEVTDGINIMNLTENEESSTISSSSSSNFAAVSSAYTSAASSSSSSSLPTAPPRVSRRVSINPELAKVLNNMLSSGAKSDPIPLVKRDSNREVRKESMADSTGDGQAATPTPTKPIRSKNLKKLLLGETSPAKPSAHPLFGRGGGLPGGAGGGLSFLDQIKNARKNAPPSEES